MCVCSNAEQANSHFWCLRLVLAIEELRQGTLLNCMDALVAKPRGVAGNDDVALLRTHTVFLGECFRSGLEGGGGSNTTLPFLLAGGLGLQSLIGAPSGGGGSGVIFAHLTFGRSTRRLLSWVVGLRFHLIIQGFPLFWFTNLHYVIAGLYGRVVNGNSFHIGLRWGRGWQVLTKGRKKTSISFIYSNIAITTLQTLLRSVCTEVITTFERSQRQRSYYIVSTCSQEPDHIQTCLHLPSLPMQTYSSWSSSRDVFFVREDPVVLDRLRLRSTVGEELVRRLEPRPLLRAKLSCWSYRQTDRQKSDSHCIEWCMCACVCLCVCVCADSHWRQMGMKLLCATMGTLSCLKQEVIV